MVPGSFSPRRLSSLGMSSNEFEHVAVIIGLDDLTELLADQHPVLEFQFGVRVETVTPG